MSEKPRCKTCHTILKEDEITHCKNCSNRWKTKEPIMKKCPCGCEFLAEWKNMKYCPKCREKRKIHEERERVCLWCREPLRAYHQQFCNVSCGQKYSSMTHKVIMAFPLDQIDNELRILHGSGKDYKLVIPCPR
jgi:phosphopantetheinyl transferase (holo-ACP synthase)